MVRVCLEHGLVVLLAVFPGRCSFTAICRIEMYSQCLHVLVEVLGLVVQDALPDEL